MLATIRTLASSGLGGGRASGRIGIPTIIVLPPSGLPGTTTVQADASATATSPKAILDFILRPPFPCPAHPRSPGWVPRDRDRAGPCATKRTSRAARPP